MIRRVAMIVVLVAAMSISPALARAQFPAMGEPTNEAERAFVQQHPDQWSQLTPEQRQTVLQNYQRWQGMSPEERGAAQRNFNEFRRLPPQERQRALEALRRWRNLPEPQRQQLRQAYRRFRALPPDQRDQIVRRYQRFEGLPPQQRQRVLNNFQRWRQMTPEQRREIRRRWRQNAGPKRRCAELVARLFDDVRGTQVADRLRRNSELAQNLIGMFAHHRRGTAEPRRASRRSARRDAAGASGPHGMLGFHDQLVGDDLRIANTSSRVSTGAHGTWLASSRDSHCARGIGREDFGGHFEALPDIARARGDGVETRIVEIHSGWLERSREALPFRIRIRAGGDVSIGSFKNQIARHGRVCLLARPMR